MILDAITHARCVHQYCEDNIQNWTDTTVAGYMNDACDSVEQYDDSETYLTHDVCQLDTWGAFNHGMRHHRSSPCKETSSKIAVSRTHISL